MKCSGKRISIWLTICLVICISLSMAACGQRETVNFTDVPEQYVKTLEYHDDFVIAQLTDIHWNTSTNIGNSEYGSRSYLLKVAEEIRNEFGHIDLIEVTGDTFCLANKKSVKTFIDTMEEIGVPYAIIWGNHDRQCKFNPNWLSRQFLNAPCSLYCEVDNDNLHERGNYVVELMQGKDVAWQIFNIDSGSSYREGAKDIGLVYDYIRQDQIDWIDFMHSRAGADVPALAYYHIPQKEFDEGYEAVSSGAEGYKSEFYFLEPVSSSPHAVSMNSVFVRNNVVGAFVGHDHATDWTFTNPDGIVYGFGVKTNKELYSADVNSETLKEYDEINDSVTDASFDLMGASVVKLLNNTGDFELYHLYLSDDENTTNATWEKY